MQLFSADAIFRKNLRFFLPRKTQKNCPKKLLIIPLDQGFLVQEVFGFVELKQFFFSVFSHLCSCQTGCFFIAYHSCCIMDSILYYKNVLIPCFSLICIDSFRKYVGHCKSQIHRKSSRMSFHDMEYPNYLPFLAMHRKNASLFY